ncbi:MAG TPA: hypothetical protein VLA52_17810, partial [Thermohalobaculum sp.]|nr:hypothetical protein [Thermohalobaculum sp.]
MATLALAGAGAAFGGLLTGGSALGLQAGWVLGQLGARALGLGVTEETREGPRIAEFRITNSSYNADLVTVDGAWRVDGHLIWLGAVREVAVTEEIGGKGGPSVSSTTYQYYADFAVAFCEAPPGGMAAILKMFAGVDAEPILDRSAGAGPIAVSADRGTVRIYLGTATQGPDPAIQAALGVADTPAYRGVCYAVFDNWRLQDAQLPPISAVVTTAASASFPTATLDPSQNALRWAELLPGGRGYINHAGDGLVIRIDLVNQAETAAADLPDFNNPVTNFPGIDGEGNFYNVTETGLNNWQLRKYDGLTFAQLGTTVTLTDPETGANIVSSVGWDEDRAFGGVRQLDGSYAGELLFIKENGGSNEVMVASTETLQNVAHYFLANGLGQGLAVDAERNLWAYSGNVAGDTVLYRIDPLTGGLSASFTVSGIVSNRIGHEPATNSLILGNLVGAGSSLARWEIETESLAGTLDGLTLEAAGNRNDSAFWNGASERGRLYLQTGGSGDFAEIDCIAMTLVTTWDNTDFGLGGDVEFALYDPTNHAVLGRDVITGDLVWRFLDRLVVGATTLRAVHERHAPRVGLAAAKLDAANLTEAVNGLVMGGRAPLRRHLDPTQL